LLEVQAGSGHPFDPVTEERCFYELDSDFAQVSQVYKPLATNIFGCNNPIEISWANVVILSHLFLIIKDWPGNIVIRVGCTSTGKVHFVSKELF